MAEEGIEATAETAATGWILIVPNLNVYGSDAMTLQFQ